MSDGSFDVQIAIYDALIAEHITELGGRIRDGYADHDEVYPHLVIENSQSIQNDAQGFNGLEEFIDLQIWSRYRGMKEAKEIASQIRDALHKKNLTVPGRTVCVWVDNVQFFNDEDGQTRRGIVTLRIQHFSESS
jgi:hypothetical protein